MRRELNVAASGRSASGKTTEAMRAALLASQCQGVAHTLTYNDGVAEAEAKHTLLEASHCLDTHAVRVHVGAGCVFISNARGKSRVMTWRERLAYRLLGGSTEIRP